MKKMTKVISLVLALVMCLALCACGKKDASYKMLDEKVSTEQYAIGFKKGNTELRDAVQAPSSSSIRTARSKRLQEVLGLQPRCNALPRQADRDHV